MHVQFQFCQIESVAEFQTQIVHLESKNQQFHSDNATLSTEKENMVTGDLERAIDTFEKMESATMQVLQELDQIAVNGKGDHSLLCHSGA